MNMDPELVVHDMHHIYLNIITDCILTLCNTFDSRHGHSQCFPCMFVNLHKRNKSCLTT